MCIRNSARRWDDPTFATFWTHKWKYLWFAVSDFDEIPLGKDKDFIWALWYGKGPRSSERVCSICLTLWFYIHGQYPHTGIALLLRIVLTKSKYPTLRQKISIYCHVPAGWGLQQTTLAPGIDKTLGQGSFGPLTGGGSQER